MTVSVCAAVMLAVGGLAYFFSPSMVVLFRAGRVIKPYYIPSESMLPTLNVNDRIMPLALPTQKIDRGMILLFNVADGVRVARAVGLAGDTIEMRDGILFINSSAALQRPIGPGPTLSDGTKTQMMAERLPDEDQEHLVLDAGASEGDNTALVRVPAGSIFVLGDNRDFAADSRFPLSQLGVEMVPASGVIGIVDTLYWSKDRARIGAPIDRSVPRQVAP
ncbi:MAG: signal peptidase I [Sphingomonas sp.]|uniref:signal peptidase I n=1 Tax=Sphingomonas sp. TaxID=28214 RepID=UPI0025DA348E|nr:signal peptidase I [Sphingomonas sp.]MBY0284285.1 signal peptidase I [Sphingomonas sp.]